MNLLGAHQGVIFFSFLAKTFLAIKKLFKKCGGNLNDQIKRNNGI